MITFHFTQHLKFVGNCVGLFVLSPLILVLFKVLLVLCLCSESKDFMRVLNSGNWIRFTSKAWWPVAARCCLVQPQKHVSFGFENILTHTCTQTHRMSTDSSGNVSSVYGVGGSLRGYLPPAGHLPATKAEACCFCLCSRNIETN